MSERNVQQYGRDEFISQLQTEFPESFAAISKYEAGILHCEVGRFRTSTEEAMDAGQAWLVERHFLFVERLLKGAGTELKNAFEISYLEDLALGEHREQRHRIVKERMPRVLRDRLIEVHAWWR